MTSVLDIGSALVAARKAAGLSQRALAQQLGVKQPQIARWESDCYRSATLTRIDAVARILGVRIDASVPLAAEEPAPYGATLTGATDAARRSLRRLGANPAAIAAFARSHHVERLDLFGSVLRDDFEPDSDVDVLVTYEPQATPTLLQLADHEVELGAILGRPVDLISRPGIERSENRLRRDRILREAQVLYARP